MSTSQVLGTHHNFDSGCSIFSHVDLKRVQQGETKLQKKGHGHIIHISDFVEEENGQLILHNKEGTVIKDA